MVVTHRLGCGCWPAKHSDSTIRRPRRRTTIVEVPKGPFISELQRIGGKNPKCAREPPILEHRQQPRTFCRRSSVRRNLRSEPLRILLERILENLHAAGKGHSPTERTQPAPAGRQQPVDLVYSALQYSISNMHNDFIVDFRYDLTKYSVFTAPSH